MDLILVKLCVFVIFTPAKGNLLSEKVNKENTVLF